MESTRTEEIRESLFKLEIHQLGLNNRDPVNTYQKIPGLRRLFQKFYPCDPFPSYDVLEPVKDFYPFMAVANQFSSISGLDIEGFNVIRDHARLNPVSLDKFQELVEGEYLEVLPYNKSTAMNAELIDDLKEAEVYFPTLKFLETFYALSSRAFVENIGQKRK